MATIMVVEDIAIFRQPIAATLNLVGFATVCAVNGLDALAKLATCSPDLILLDLAMPQMDGITFLKRLRADPQRAKTPVILLTAVTDRERILEAAKLGVQECMLKSRFSTKELIERIGRQLGGLPTRRAGAASAAPAAAAAAPAAAAAAAAKAASPAGAAARPPGDLEAPALQPDIDVPSLLTRERSLERAQKAMEVHTLSGVVAQVIRLAASPRSDLSSLSSLISCDAVLAAKVLQAANSAAFTSNGGPVVDINEAVRRIGCSAVRNIAAMLGVYDAMPPVDDAEFNFVRCWQHSLAVATLCERLVNQSNDPDNAGVAYLVGLCHDLGEIMFHSHFREEYKQVLDYEQRTGRRREDLERDMLGLTHRDLIGLILGRIGLPDNIRQPIEALYDPTGRGGQPTMTKVLRLADAYANGLMLGTSVKCEFSPFSRGECKAAIGNENPTAPSPESFRGEILAQTVMLARLSPAAERALTTPLFPQTGTRVWLAHDPALSRFDPTAAALSSLAQVQVHDRVPFPAEAADFDRVLILARAMTTAGFGVVEVKRLAAATPCLWLVGKKDMPAPPDCPAPPTQWPVRLDQLAAFVSATQQTDKQAA